MKKYTQLKEEERVEIFKLRQSGHKIKKIAATLNRAKSTISRELARGKIKFKVQHALNIL